MKELTVAQIARAVGGSAGFDGVVTSVCTDTRAFVPGCLFVAIKGENFDGHDFARAAAQKGAVAVLAQRETGSGIDIVVPDTVAAQLRLAGYYRSRFNIPVIGVTGSVGKTTVRGMTHAVLSAKGRVLKAEGNYNNEIGVPRVLFSLDDSYSAAVIELGMSGFSEISRMSSAVAPTLGIIGNIGVAHIESLGSRDNILRAKLELLDGMADGAPLILNGDDDKLCTVASDVRPIYFYSINDSSCEFRASNIEQDTGQVSFTTHIAGETARVVLPLPGIHNVYNALAAMTAGHVCGVSPAESAEALASYRTEGMRQRFRVGRGIYFIEDCYNASPDSVRASIAVLRDMKVRRRIAVLGDMLELGAIAPDAHADVGRFAAANGTDILLAFGDMSEYTVRAARESGLAQAEHFTSKDELAARLVSLASKGDAVLFKASRGMKLEEVIKKLYEELEIQ